jgi:hypothetical protein
MPVLHNIHMYDTVHAHKNPGIQHCGQSQILTLLNSRMAELDKEIADLKEEIKGYDAEYKTAPAEDKRLLLQMINSRTETLNRLLEEKKAQSGGKLLRHLMWHNVSLISIHVVNAVFLVLKFSLNRFHSDNLFVVLRFWWFTDGGVCPSSG